MVREAVGPEPELNYWQKRWTEIDNGRQRCLECRATIDKEES